MQKLQDSVFSIVKTANLSPAVFSYLQPTEDFPEKTPQGGILSDTKHGWLALGPKFCVVDLRTGLKVAAHTFGAVLSNYRTTVTSVAELPTPLTDNSMQLVISLEYEDIAGMICVFHVNGSQILRCIQTEVVVTQLAVSDEMPNGPFTCYDGIIIAGTKSGEIIVFDLNRASLIQALKDLSQGYEQMIRSEENAAHVTFLPLSLVQQIEAQRDLALENDDHSAVLLNENSLVDGQYIFRNPDGTVRMKAKRDHIRVTVLQYIPQLASVAVGFNFGAFQIWNLLNLDLEFTSQVNVECLPVTHFGFQEPCDDPRAFCYLWVVFSVIDRFDEEEFPLAVMYSLTYQGKRMLSDTKCLYQEFLTATIRFQVELSAPEDETQLIGGRCVSCHTYSVNSTLGGEGEDSMLNICQLVWECWGENANSSGQHGMLLFDLDQWYKDQMPATYQLQSNAFMSATWCSELARGACVTLDLRLSPSSVSVYCAPTRLEEHFYPNSLHYDCICLNTSEACVLSTIGIQRQIINSMDEVGPTALLNPTRLYNACVATGLVPLYLDASRATNQDEQRQYLLSVALEARLSRFLKRCAHDWATGSHSGAGCTLTFLVDWCWSRAIELKENARELTSPLFTSSAMPDRNVVRCLEHCVQQLTQLTGLLDAVLTKCCNLVVPDALSEMEEKYKGIGTVSLYFQVVQWFLRCGLLPERSEACSALSYPGTNLASTYSKRRLKLHRLQDNAIGDDSVAKKPCSLLYIDQLIEQEFGGERVHQMWMRGGSECNGLYPPPSLYSLLRLYLLPDIAEEHKHSLVLYLLVDYSMVYDEVRYEAVIRRLMQFPTMFGLSNTAIKATQAFWHLDHRDFDFALDQLQCLTGNTLSDWQHNVVLSSLLAQKKTQAALQYLHVRKPAPIQNLKDNMNSSNNRVNDHDKLEDWQSCCNLYLARGLVFEALDVIRMCVQNAGSFEDKITVLNFFFKGCRNTGHLSKILQVTLLPFEEEIFIRYLENCNESQTSDILIMYYLQQARYLEAEQYNSKIKHSKPRTKDLTGSLESLADVKDRESARDTIVEVACSSLPTITNTVAHCAQERDIVPHVVAPKPMSVFIQATSPKNFFTYKSSFIQDTIENASETWINKPMMRRGIKRALNIEETPFICTPKLAKNKNIFTMDKTPESTPRKRSRLDLTGTPKTPKTPAYRGNDTLSKEMSVLLDMPEVQSPDIKLYGRSGAGTPHSILKIRNSEAMLREAPSPVDSRYLGDSDDELLETASNHTHYSDSTNKHLRFTIPTASESGSTPSPPVAAPAPSFPRGQRERERSASIMREKEMDMSLDSFVTTESHVMNEPHPLESPPKKMAVESNVKSRKSYKDSVRSRRSLSISANSSLSEDPNTSIESIADIPITLVNPRYSGEVRRRSQKETRDTDNTSEEEGKSINMTATRDTDNTVEEKREVDESMARTVEVPKTPKGRRGIRAVSSESTPLMNRSRSGTPERLDSPVVTIPLSLGRNRSRSGTPERLDSPVFTKPLSLGRNRSRSRTPEISPRSSPLAPIIEQPQRETETQPHPAATMLSVPRQLRSRSRTPERIEKVVESPRLEAIKESPTKPSDSPTSSPTRRSLRSRSRTPEVEVPQEPPIVEGKTRILRSRAKTPEKLMSPKKEHKSAKKPLARIVLEANAFAVTKQILEKEPELNEEEKESIIECTPMKTLKQVSSLMDVTISPIVSKSILQSSSDSMLSESVKETKTADDTVADLDVKSIPGFTMNETCFGKSVLHSYESSAAENTQTEESIKETKSDENVSKLDIKSLPAFSINESLFEKSVLHSYQSSVGDTSSIEDENKTSNNDKIELKPSPGSLSLSVNDFDKSVLRSCDVSAMETSEEKNEKGTNKPNLSSLMTSDSDIEMKDQWEDKTDKQDTASIIQKEKEKIVEIEREIHEIEGDMSDEDDDSEGEVESESDSEEQEADTDETESESSEEDACSDPEEVISINDSSESSSSGHELEEKANKEMQTIPVISEAKVVEVNIQKHNTQNDDEEPTVKEANQIAEVIIEKEETEKEKTDKKDVQDVEISTDPLNQACMSMMTDDNSERELDQSQMDLNYSDEKGEAEKVDKEIAMETDAQPPTEKVVHIEVTVEVAPADIEELEQNTPTTESITDQNTKQEVSPASIVDETKSVSQDTNLIDVVDARRMDVAIEETTFKSNKHDEQSTENKSVEEKTEKVEKIVSKDDDVPKIDERSSSPPKPEIKKLQDINVAETKKLEVEAIVTESQKLEENKVEEETVKEKPSRTRKRAQSTSSNKSTKEEKIAEPKTPVTRKRSQSIASNKSATEVEDKTPESGKNEVTSTPSSRTRAKTPTSTEVRKILTRRASKELSLLEKMDDTQSSILEESTLTTPKRRSTRIRSKNTDDSASIASVSSVKSTRSKASEDAGDLKQVRKGRKSVLQTKPDLSVIPELAVEEGSKIETNEDIINEYSSSRRLTRNQKSVLDSLLARKPSPRRRASAASRSVSENSHDDDDDADLSSTHSAAFDVQSMDRMSLLNKGDFEGSPDLSEIPSNASPESIASDASKQRRARVTRAVSESKATPKAAKITRRMSVDIGATPETDSPSKAEAFSVRGRRASFNRACEALHTPKGRRTSTDIRTDSQPGSPAASEPMEQSTPSRRTRRAGSTHSTPSHTKSDAGKRSKKSSSVEESKDTKN